MTEISGFGFFEAGGLAIFDLASAEDFNRHAAGFALCRSQANQRNVHLAIARQSHFTSQGEARGLLHRLKKSDNQFLR